MPKWDRITKQTKPQEKRLQQENKYVQALIEQSQAWLKNWPDTVEGCVAKAEQKKKKQRSKEIALVKEFSNRKIVKNNEEVIQQARQQIFEESCYGRKLISALHESKDQEEREAQINFKKEIKEKETEQEQKITKAVKFCTFDLDKDEETMKEQQKCIDVETSKANKEMFEKQKEEETKAKEKQKQEDLGNAKLMKRLLELEKEAETKMKLLEKQALDQCAAEYKKTKDELAKWEAEYLAKIEVCRKEQEQLKFQIKQVHDRIFKEYQDTSKMKNNFNATKQFQLEKKKIFDDFIEKHIKKGEDRADKRERKNIEKIKQHRKNNKTVAEINKSMAEAVNHRQDINKCYCDRQCYITKSEKPRIMKKAARDTIEPEVRAAKPLPYFGPQRKLLVDLRRREKEPSPWSGTNSLHVLFFKNAEKTLSDCKNKIPARKVIDEYKKYNGLNRTTPNYN
ncbi:nucleoporin GLE1-like [Spodoptera litura]|uniref:Nucleoporin GLE1-like n=1 Tax=Spodoptera litura TaxID=69820 RepID=A0A9J7IU05_SPOLT|nr:nucleoporin GLE1-like [Spodoptera litura]